MSFGRVPAIPNDRLAFELPACCALSTLDADRSGDGSEQDNESSAAFVRLFNETMYVH